MGEGAVRDGTSRNLSGTCVYRSNFCVKLDTPHEATIPHPQNHQPPVPVGVDDRVSLVSGDYLQLVLGIAILLWRIFFIFRVRSLLHEKDAFII